MRKLYKPMTKHQSRFFEMLTGYAHIHLRHIFSDNDINPTVLFKLIRSDDILTRRDEFYSLFKSNYDADTFWTKVTDWRLETEDGIYPLHWYEDDVEC